VIRQRRRPLLLLVAASLAFGSAGYASVGGASGNNAGGRASVDPPHESHGHCGHTDLKPPCKHYKG
jgi:hypothetical protein